MAISDLGEHNALALMGELGLLEDERSLTGSQTVSRSCWTASFSNGRGCISFDR